jgi:putative ABC transport system permease protein
MDGFFYFYRKSKDDRVNLNTSNSLHNTVIDYKGQRRHCMLELRNIKKSYKLAGQWIPALKGIDLEFKAQEFVSILGPSGCGKTTLLNLIGGLDRYTSGDLLVEGKSTKDFSDAEWDAYRNATIGFVFQSYNLISHLSVLDNVEMALRLSGVPAKERRDRAIKVLTEVGLKDHLKKKPNQMSGGQMQRVAIARALVNNPKVLLADEPTGAIDSKTSDQIMDLIKEIAKDRLVIMVTHNPEIAEKYSDRIIRLLDGEVISDSNPTQLNKDGEKITKLKTKRTTMPYLTAIKTSMMNLLTKKGRTIVTAFAGSIGIIGIALVLSISSGMTNYVNNIQSDTLAGFPLVINQNVSTTSFGPPDPTAIAQGASTGDFPTIEVIYSYDRASATVAHQNILDDAFIAYLDAMDPTLYNSISTTKGISLNILAKTSTGEIVKTSSGSSSGATDGPQSTTVFSSIPNNPEFVKSQYDVLYGQYPEAYNELVLIVDSQNQLDVAVLTALGITIDETYTFDSLIGTQVKVIPNNLAYTEFHSVYIPSSDMATQYDSSEAITLTVVGIMRVNPDASSEVLDTGIGYTTMLTDMMLTSALNSDIVLAQIASPDINILTGRAFNTQISYQDVMQSIGGDATPTSIQIYPTSFESKDTIKTYLDAYNTDKTDEESIVYSDMAESIASSMTDIIDSVTLVLAAFAGISLLVSSIMIGIITYVSVIERTKEIGIMRSLGARKRDISRIFNAETILIGLSAGLLGVGLTWILMFPINIVINNMLSMPNFAYLSFTNAAALLVLSTVLTLVAGLIPSRVAANQDPVVALRTE